MESNKTQNKTNPFLLSNQVKRELQRRGYSSVFNYSDYKFFKSQCKDAFNKAVAIAKKFIDEAEPQTNDFNQYSF